MPVSELQVKPGDCDSFGHVNNAVYVSHIEHALAQKLSILGFMKDWQIDGQFYWQMSTMAVEYRQPAVFGDRLSIDLWLEQSDTLTPVFGCEIRRPTESPDDGPPPVLVRSLSSWQRFARASDAPIPLPGDALAAFPKEGGSLPRKFRLPEDLPSAKRYEWHHTILRSELGSNGHVHAQAIYNWLEESVFDASMQAGWPLERMLRNEFVVLQTRHDSRFFTFPREGDAIKTVSRLLDVRRLRGTWKIDIYRQSDDHLFASDYSTGVFLNLAGRPASPPAGMMDEIQFG